VRNFLWVMGSLPWRKIGWVVLGLAIAAALAWCQLTGRRFDQLVSEPFLGFSRHQWGILLSGGLGAGLAVLGVVWTLKVQRQQFDVQQEIRTRAEAKRILSGIIPVVRRIARRLEGHTPLRLSFLSDPAQARVVFKSKADFLAEGATELFELGPSEQLLAGAIWDLAAVESALSDETLLANLTAKQSGQIVVQLWMIESAIKSWTATNPTNRSFNVSEVWRSLRVIMRVLRSAGWEGPEIAVEIVDPRELARMVRRSNFDFFNIHLGLRRARRPRPEKR